jgi:flagellar biosynthesis protein FlhG
MHELFSPRSAPLDQAHGLRQLFAARRQRFVPLVHNPHVSFGGVSMEQLCAALAEAELHTLVVDAAESASPPDELAQVDLSACIERLSPSVSYLAARGLPMRHLDARGSTAGFLQALAEAAPRADVVLVHAGAADLARLFARRLPRPILQSADRPEGLTHAYASMKLLAQRLGVLSFDLLVVADAASPRVSRIADSLADCADRFLGAVLADWALIDPFAEPDTALPPELLRLAGAQLRTGDEAATAATPYPPVPAPWMAAAHAN